MATQPVDRYTLEQYLEAEDRLDYRSEFHDGHIIPVGEASPNHASLSAAITGLLRSAFVPRCSVYDSSLNLYILSANKVLHPDTTVVCGKPNCPRPDCLDNPTILVEVTSPSTKDYDYGTKREYYFTLPSLQHYLLASQTERVAGHYERSGSAWIDVDRGPDEIISLGEIEIPVAAIYANILS